MVAARMADWLVVVDGLVVVAVRMGMWTKCYKRTPAVWFVVRMMLTYLPRALLMVWYVSGLLARCRAC